MLLELLKKSFHPSFNALLAMAIIIALVGSAISVAFSVHHARLAMQELQQLREQRKALDVEWGSCCWSSTRGARMAVWALWQRKSCKCNLHRCKTS